MQPGLFRNRREAGRRLAQKLAHYANRPDVIVLALPRGGVPVAHEVARALGAPLYVFLVRKLGVPGYEELAMGAVATGGVRVLNDTIVSGLGIPDYIIDAVVAKELEELKRPERVYRGGRPPPDVRGRTVVLIDDGLATGATMQAAIKALRQLQPARIVVAVPTAAPDTCEALRAEVDEVICAITPEPMTRTQNSQLLVTDRLVGVVTLKDMLKFLSLKLELEEAQRVDLPLAAARAEQGGLSQRA
jgi:predicted phosphoribosyltransferase